MNVAGNSEERLQNAVATLLIGSAPLQHDQVDLSNEEGEGQAEALALSSPLLLPYERQLVEEAIQDDCLIITASGLGWQRVVAVLLRIAYHARMAEAQARERPHPGPSPPPPPQQPATDPSAPSSSAAATAAAAAAPPPPPPQPQPSAARPSAPPPTGGCVLVLGASPWQRALIAAELARHDPGLPPPLDITNEVPALERIQLYRAQPGGRPLFITPRILTVDLLARRLTGRDVAGLLLLNAHRATDTSGEGFAVALLRADCPRGAQGAAWVRAVSDAPTAFNQGFNKVEKVMKALHLRRLHLWPRFQEHVRQCLDEHKPVVVEWDQELSSPMVLIQAALLEVLEGLIRELRRTNNKLDTSELVLENGVLRSFDEIIRRQLDPIWHTVSWKTRRICADLRTLRELSSLLLTSDCVTFLAHLEGLRQSEGVRCVWLFHDATHAIYEQARRRVYIYRQPGSAPGGGGGGGSVRAAATGGGGGGGTEVEAVLEEPPKWGLLVEVLREVQRQRQQLRALGRAGPAEGQGQGSAPGATAAAAAGDGGHTWPGTVTPAGAGKSGRVPAGSSAEVASAVAAAPEGLEVVDLADSSGDEGGGSGGSERGLQGREENATVGKRSKGPTGAPASAAAAAAAESTAPVGEPLRSLLQDLGLIGGSGGGDGAGGSGSDVGVSGASDVAVLTPRDLRLLAAAGEGPVLVVARELHAARLLERVVRDGGRAVMQGLYESYLLSKLQAPAGARGSGGGGDGGAGGSAGGRGGGRGGRGGGGGWKRYRSGVGDPDEGGRGPVLRPGEHQALLAEAQRVGVERGAIPAPRGRAPKRAKPNHGVEAGDAGAAAPAAALDGGRGRGGRGRGRGHGVAATSSGRGHGVAATSSGRGHGVAATSSGRSRRRKPDDSPLRVAAAAAAEDLEAGEGEGGGGAAATAEAQHEEHEVEGVARAPSRSSRGTAKAAGTRRAAASGAHRTARGRDAGGAVGGGEGTDGARRDNSEEDGGASGGVSGDDDGDDIREALDRAQAKGRRRGPANQQQQPQQQRQQAAAGTLCAGGGDGRNGGAGRGQKARSEAVSGVAPTGGAYGSAENYEGGDDGPGAAWAGAATAPTMAATAAAGGPSAPQGPLPPLLRDVHFMSLDSHDEFVLWRLRPSFVIMYEPDLAFLRQVEVYQAERCLAGGCPLWLHTLSYGQSLEQQRFRAAVERERDTVLRLIQAKQHLVLPAAAPLPPPGGSRGPGGGLGGGALSADLWLDVYSANALTRAAGGRAAGRAGAAAAQPRRLVVDVREFMSSLPAVLHQKGFELLPVTLEVGDYVLSPQLVVERKSLPDLHASLASGRLYHQAEVMCRHYARPLLLIEFDADRQFGLQSASELGDDIDPKNVISKLTLLTLHFPKLRLLWSRSPHATADIFAALKSNQDEPDPAAAALVGVPLGPDGAPLPLGQQQGGSGAAAAALEAVVNQPALELLRRLPGVNDSNYRAILGHVSSLAELAALPLERLEAIMASTKNAKALRDFLDAPCPRI